METTRSTTGEVKPYNNFAAIAKTLTNKELEKRMGEIVAKTVQDISADYEKRRLGWKQEPSLLKGGVWMSNEYYKALKELGDDGKARLEYFIEKGYFFHAFPPKSFKNIPCAESHTGFSGNTIALKEGCKPSEALLKIIDERELCFLDCGSVLQLAQNYALLQAFGPEKFDHIFRCNSKYPMTIGPYDFNKVPLCKGFLAARSNKMGSPGKRPVQVGDRLCFKNDEMYLEKHSVMGDCQAMNVVPINATPGNQKFVGFGLPSVGVTEAEIEQYLIDQYNQKPQDLEPVNDIVGSKAHPLGKAGYKIICDYLDPNNSTEECSKLWELFQEKVKLIYPFFSSDDLEENKVDLDNYRIPLTKKNIKDKGFGYVPTSPTKFNIPFIQKLIKTPINDL